MRVFVCVKEILDPETPASAFRIDESGTGPLLSDTPAWVMDSYAENALETGLQLRDAHRGSRLTALCLGPESADSVLRRTLAATADEAVRVWDSSWAALDGLATGARLGAAIRALGGADLVLCGRQAGDIEQGLVGSALAEELDLPCVTIGRRIVVGDGRARVEREADGDVETVEVGLPAVVTMTSSAANVPRMPKVRDVMLARAKPIRTLEAAQLRASKELPPARVHLERIEAVPSRDRCEFVEGPDAGRVAAALVQRLRDLRVI
jgi:electron transfer flavoprotein beta subunit